MCDDFGAPFYGELCRRIGDAALGGGAGAGTARLRRDYLGKEPEAAA
jgi:hypothetical protein